MLILPTESQSKTLVHQLPQQSPYSIDKHYSPVIEMINNLFFNTILAVNVLGLNEDVNGVCSRLLKGFPDTNTDTSVHHKITQHLFLGFSSRPAAILSCWTLLVSRPNNFFHRMISSELLGSSSKAWTQRGNIVSKSWNI